MDPIVLAERLDEVERALRECLMPLLECLVLLQLLAKGESPTPLVLLERLRTTASAVYIAASQLGRPSTAAKALDLLALFGGGESRDQWQRKIDRLFEAAVHHGG